MGGGAAVDALGVDPVPQPLQSAAEPIPTWPRNSRRRMRPMVALIPIPLVPGSILRADVMFSMCLSRSPLLCSRVFAQPPSVQKIVSR